MDPNNPQTAERLANGKKLGGRPAKFASAEQMEEKIEEYFRVCREGREIGRFNKKGEYVKGVVEIPPTIEGLALHLGFESTQSLKDYSEKPEFSECITRAKTTVMRSINEMSLMGFVESRIAGLNMAAHGGYSTKVQVEAKGIEDLLREAHEAGK